MDRNEKETANESINETPYELGGMKVYSKADGLKKVKSMKKTAGIWTKTKTNYMVIQNMYNLHTKNKKIQLIQILMVNEKELTYDENPSSKIDSRIGLKNKGS